VLFLFAARVRGSREHVVAAGVSERFDRGCFFVVYILAVMYLV